MKQCVRPVYLCTEIPGATLQNTFDAPSKHSRQQCNSAAHVWRILRVCDTGKQSEIEHAKAQITTGMQTTPRLDHFN